MNENKNYNAVLTESQSVFQSRGMSVLGEGFKEVVSNPALIELYVDQLLEGASPQSAASMRQLMENANHELLRESSLSGIDPVASLSMPVIRRLWPLSALKDALKTEVATTPAFVISYTKPYLQDAKGDKHYLPLRGGYADLGLNAAGKAQKKLTVTFGAEAVKVVDTDLDGFLNVSTGSNIKRQPLDKDIRIVTANGGTIEVNRKLNVLNGASFQVGEADFMVRADLNAGKITVVKVADDLSIGENSVGAGDGTGINTLEIVVHRSEEYNEASLSASFDIERKDVVIPAGRHLNSPLPIEALKDMMALYNIDGTAEAVDIMTNVFAMDLDREILEFLDDSFDNLPGNIGGINDNQGAGEYTFTFDVRPHSGFAGGPALWREEIKPMIDHLAQRVKNSTYLQNGVFTILANPLDAQIITNINWTFRGSTETRDGVEVDYSVGIFQGANTFRVISSVLVPAGEMLLVFTPTSGKQMTYKYYPYQFNVEKGYIDANRSRVPSIMMTKRHAIEEYIPAIGRIQIINNDGNGQFLAGPWGPADSETKWGGQ